MNNKNKPYPLTDETLTELERTISPERFSAYLKEADGNRKKAICLYVWNTSISAAFYGPLQSLEIALRNAMHDRLSEIYGADWYDNPAINFNEKHLEQLERVKSDPRQKEHEAVPSRLIATLSFGFWVFLLSSNYDESLWRSTLYKAFPHARAIRRKQTHKLLVKLLTIRNQIAHHSRHALV